MKIDLVLCVLLCCVTATAQPGASARRDRGGNPLAGKAEAIAQGEQLYGVRCAACHGKDARGGQGPDLHKSRVFQVSPERRFFDIVKDGFPSGEMPPLNAPDDQIWQIIAWVHSQTKPGQGPPVAGDVERGRKTFADAGCLQCHITAGKGGVLGPDLSSIALQRSTKQIRESLLDPSAKIAEGFGAAVVTMKNGRRIEGTLKNEDNFSVQLMRGDGELTSVMRRDISDVRVATHSPMPPVATKLSPVELQNLLAFLDRQRAPFRRFQMSFQNY